MLKRWTALLLAVMLIFLTACGAQKEYKLSAVFAAAEEDRTQWLADPDNAALWEQLGLSGSKVGICLRSFGIYLCQAECVCQWQSLAVYAGSTYNIDLFILFTVLQSFFKRRKDFRTRT